MIDIKSPIVNDTPSGNVQTNAVYDPKSQYNLDKFALTIIEKKQITLGKLLGSGAFGKVKTNFLLRYIFLIRPILASRLNELSWKNTYRETCLLVWDYKIPLIIFQPSRKEIGEKNIGPKSRFLAYFFTEWLEDDQGNLVVSNQETRLPISILPT